MLRKPGSGLSFTTGFTIIYKVNLQASALRPPCSKSCTHLTGRKHLTLCPWALVIFLCSGGREWPEGRLSGPSDDVLNLSTTLAPSKMKNTSETFKSPSESCSTCNGWNMEFFGTFISLGQKTWLPEESPWISLALPVAVPERLTAVINLLATQGCVDLWAKEGDVVLQPCPIT